MRQELPEADSLASISSLPHQLSLDIFNNCLTCWIQVQNPHTSSYHLDFMRSIFIFSKLNLKLPWLLGYILCSLAWRQSWFLQAVQHSLASLGSIGRCDFPVDSSVRTSGGSIFLWFLTSKASSVHAAEN